MLLEVTILFKIFKTFCLINNCNYETTYHNNPDYTYFDNKLV
jgi:hypothetical protein